MPKQPDKSKEPPAVALDQVVSQREPVTWPNFRESWHVWLLMWLAMAFNLAVLLWCIFGKW